MLLPNTPLQNKQIDSIPQSLVTNMVKSALMEDIGNLQGNNINSDLISSDKVMTAQVITREDIILCGSQWVDTVFKIIDSDLIIQWHYSDRQLISANKVVFTVAGLVRNILSGERTALNFLQTLSAVATKTWRYKVALQGTTACILDTRKTIPGYRIAQKYAVNCGGGLNHRMGLFDSFLIKENHILACNNSIASAVISAKKIAPNKFIEVEVENLQQFSDALKLPINLIMLDNFNLTDMRTAVKFARGKIKLEASGNVSLNTVKSIAKTGVDFISVGDLTKNLQAVDLSMRF